MCRIIFCILLGLTTVSCQTTSQSESSVNSAETASITGKTWQWVATITPAEEITVSEPDRYTVTFADDGKAQMLFDCNRGGGDYTISDKKLSFGPLISTRMACPEGSLDAVFMRDLQKVDSFFIKDGALYLELGLESGTMHFQPAG